MRIEIRVVPNSGSFRIKIRDEEVRIYLKSRAEANKANIELLKELKKRLKREVRLVSGAKGRKKILEIDIDEKGWERFIERQLL